ncbi:MAG: hypothetical protein ACPGR8_01265 [Limisphaerales bacterium]
MSDLENALWGQPERLLERLKPVLIHLSSKSKSPALWPGGSKLIPTIGFRALHDEIETTLSLAAGARRVFAVRALVIMVFALFPGLWVDQRAWKAHSDKIEAQLVGRIAKTSTKKSEVVETATDPLTLVVQWSQYPGTRKLFERQHRAEQQ